MKTIIVYENNSVLPIINNGEIFFLQRSRVEDIIIKI